MRTTRDQTRSCGSAGQARAGWARLLPLLLMLSLAVNVIDCVRVESRSAGISRLVGRPPRRHRNRRRARA